jgi:hypothetical protein
LIAIEATFAVAISVMCWLLRMDRQRFWVATQASGTLAPSLRWRLAIGANGLVEPCARALAEAGSALAYLTPKLSTSAKSLCGNRQRAVRAPPGLRAALKAHSQVKLTCS